MKATLEIEFFHQTASRFVTPTAEAKLSEVYNKISQAYVRRPGDDMKSQLDGVKKTLADTRRATQIEYLCFRKEKEKTAKVAASASNGGAGAGVKGSSNVGTGGSGKLEVPSAREGEGRRRRQPAGGREAPRAADGRI